MTNITQRTGNYITGTAMISQTGSCIEFQYQLIIYYRAYYYMIFLHPGFIDRL